MNSRLFVPALLALCITAIALRAADGHDHTASAPAGKTAAEGCHAKAEPAKQAGGCCMKPAAAAAAVRPYPLDTCVVSGEKLGAHGKPVVFTDGTREVKLCCASCEGDWKKDREALLKKLDAADAAKAAPAKP